MNCRFCQQWNSPGTLRCVFCENLLEGSEDATKDGRLTSDLGRTTQPGTPLAGRPQLDLGPPKREIVIAPRTAATLVGLGLLALLLLMAWAERC